MSRRLRQINHLIQRELSDLLTREVNDPRLKGIISITEVEVSADLRQAKVFISILGSEEEREQAFAGLISASGFLRQKLGERLSLRYTPELRFQRDNSIERGSHLLHLMEKLAQENPPL